MKPPPDEFDQLQRLLASKRYDQPPAKYLERFSERVKDRIEHPDPPGPLTWRQRLGLDEDWKPAIMCAWGVAVCASLLIGIIVSLSFRMEPSSPNPGPILWTGGLSPFGAVNVSSQAPAGAVDSSTDPVFTLHEHTAR
jgi:hypothetical protein